MKLEIPTAPYQEMNPGNPWVLGKWPCRWVTVPGEPAAPYVAAYRLKFRVADVAQVRVHVTADNRYTLYLDGERVGRGPEMGVPTKWYFETYELALTPGEHTLVAQVQCLGAHGVLAQTSLRHGFLFSPEEEAWWKQLGTGNAAWEAMLLPGYSIQPQKWADYSGVSFHLDAARHPWGFQAGNGDAWQPVKPLGDGLTGALNGESAQLHYLAPGPLPGMLSQPWLHGAVRAVDNTAAAGSSNVPYTSAAIADSRCADWQAWLGDGEPVEVPAHTSLRVLVDLEDYVCFYPQLTVSGGAGSHIQMACIEALFTKGDETKDYHSGPKGNRNVVEGCFFRGRGVEYTTDGGADRVFDTLWWLAGRYLQILITTGDEPLTLKALDLEETRYPLEMTAQFTTDSAPLNSSIPIMVRALQMCSHETYMDCPYYEQLMYVGDTRLEVLATYLISGDDRLPRKAIEVFGDSRSPNGLTWSRRPSRSPQFIPPFSLWWVLMVYDFALWRDDSAFVRGQLPTARGVLDTFLLHIDAQGLLVAPNGWNFVDWVPEWFGGMPEGAHLGINGTLNWHLVLTLARMAELEEHLGELEMAARWRRSAAALAKAVDAALWDDTRGLYAEDAAHTQFTEHAQCLTILSGLVPSERRERVVEGLFSAPDLARTTIYFSHYLFEAATLCNRMDVVFERLELWTALAGQGFKTTPEQPEPSRSDCHAWGAHPLYHCFANIAGIRPASFGFGEVVIRPQLGPLKEVNGVLPHLQGDLAVNLRLESGELHGEILLPGTVSGRLELEVKSIPLQPGKNTF